MIFFDSDTSRAGYWLLSSFPLLQPSCRGFPLSHDVTNPISNWPVTESLYKSSFYSVELLFSASTWDVLQITCELHSSLLLNYDNDAVWGDNNASGTETQRAKDRGSVTAKRLAICIWAYLPVSFSPHVLIRSKSIFPTSLHKELIWADLLLAHKEHNNY